MIRMLIWTQQGLISFLFVTHSHNNSQHIELIDCRKGRDERRMENERGFLSPHLMLLIPSVYINYIS